MISSPAMLWLGATLYLFLYLFYIYRNRRQLHPSSGPIGEKHEDSIYKLFMGSIFQ
jgi:hypothetical protein